MDDDVAAADGGGLAWILERKLCFLSARFPRFVALKYIFFFYFFYYSPPIQPQTSK